MNQYELALVLNAKDTDDVREAALEKIKGYIERFGGKISDVDEWGKRRLAYEINKMNEGYYFFIAFDGESTTPIEVERNIRLMEPVIRFLVVRNED